MVVATADPQTESSDRKPRKPMRRERVIMTAIGRRPEAKVKPAVGHMEKREPSTVPVRALSADE